MILYAASHIADMVGVTLNVLLMLALKLEKRSAKVFAG